MYSYSKLLILMLVLIGCPTGNLIRAQESQQGQTREIVSQFHQMKDSYADMNFTIPYLGTITARTLIVHGDRDEFFPVAIPVELFGAIPKAYLWIIPNGPHIPNFGARAKIFQDEVLAFLRGNWE